MAPEFPKKVERLFTIGEVEDAAEEQHFLWRRGAPSGVVAVCIFRSGLRRQPHSPEFETTDEHG
jgi:hypothetical protein